MVICLIILIEILKRQLKMQNFIKKTKCDAVKLEGGKKIISIVKKLVQNKIPVMGHVGILPQTEKNLLSKEKNNKKVIEF